jgi:hypothetical protein
MTGLATLLLDPHGVSNGLGSSVDLEKTLLLFSEIELLPFGL